MFTLRHFTLSASILCSTFASVPTTAQLPRACDTPDILLTNERLRHSGRPAGELACYRLDLTEPGLLHFDVSVAGNLDPEDVRLDLRASKTIASHTENSDLRILGRTATESLAWASAGTYFVEVRAEDPTRPLAAHRLTSRFLAAGKSETDGELELEPEKSETDGELELEPEKSVASDFLSTCSPLRKSETDGELELEPEKSETDGELELEPEKSETDGELELEPEKSGTCRSMLPWLHRLCGDSTADDHADSLLCASRLDRTASGEIHNGWGDDSDVFRFEVEGWKTVEIIASGEISPQGTLYDRQGQRLATVASGVGEAFRLVRTLGPGSYFLRLTSPGSDGSYNVVVEDYDR